MNKRIGILTGVLLGLVALIPAMAADTEPVARTLFTDVNVFDGQNEKLVNNANVLVEGNLIKQVSTKPIKADGATVINGDPLTDISILTKPDENLALTMKDGRIYKNTIK